MGGYRGFIGDLGVYRGLEGLRRVYRGLGDLGVQRALGFWVL